MLAAYAYLNAYFDKILVLSLRRATERHEALQKNLKGLNYEIYWGVDKRDFTLEEVIEKGIYDKEKANHYNRHGARVLSAGEVACSWSHRNIYELILQKGWQRVLILEDDVVPNLEALPLLPHTFDQLPPDWDLVYLGYLSNEEVLLKHHFKRFFYKILAYFGAYQWLTPREVENLYPKPYSKNLRRAGLHDCTHAYAITHTAASQLLKAQTPIYSSADELLTHGVLKNELKGFICKPAFFDQEDFVRGHQNLDSYVSAD
ncbi:MAG: glycosyltransferase family 25 protein [Runella sp.]